MNCPVCGHTDGACAGDEREVVTVSGVVKAGGPVRVPKQNVRVGKAGYQGNVEIYDPKFPKLRMVQPSSEVAIETEDTAPAQGASLASSPEPGAAPKPKKKAKA